MATPFLSSFIRTSVVTIFYLASMALILNIDTAVQAPSICLANNKQVLDIFINPTEKAAAAWLHTAIQNILQDNGCKMDQLDAIAISSGPGSYTGLRVGMSAAKGLCYTLSKPLIGINTLQMMAASCNETTANLLCPMIDARRMEVFTALYDDRLNEVMPLRNMILDANSFDDWLDKYSISFFGNGSTKAATVIRHKNASFKQCNVSAAAMVMLALEKFELHQFSDLAYAEPLYGKDFHSPISKKNY